VQNLRQTYHRVRIILDALDSTPRCRGSSESLVHLEMELILRKIDARFASKVPSARKSFLTHLMELLGDMGHVESLFFPFGDSVSVDAR
jgi:hypothetical protein